MSAEWTHSVQAHFILNSLSCALSGLSMFKVYMVLEYWVHDEAAIDEQDERAEWFFSSTTGTLLNCD